MQPDVDDLALVARVLLGFGLAYLLGFERELRGSAAGNRTFALVGAASASVAAVSSASPQVLAGIITGVGFIGGGVILQSKDGAVRGITTAATIFAAAATGIVVGTGHLALGVLVSALVLLILELRFMPGLRFLDAQNHAHRFRDDSQNIPHEHP